MTESFRLTIAQLDPTVGDIASNAAKALSAWHAGGEAGAQLVALPEMFLTGYQTQDLIRKPAFIADARAHLEQLASACADGPALAIGGPDLVDGRLYNAYFVLRGGEIASVTHKHFL